MKVSSRREEIKRLKWYSKGSHPLVRKVPIRKTPNMIMTSFLPKIVYLRLTFARSLVKVTETSVVCRVHRNLTVDARNYVKSMPIKRIFIKLLKQNVNLWDQIFVLIVLKWIVNL